MSYVQFRLCQTDLSTLFEKSSLNRRRNNVTSEKVDRNQVVINDDTEKRALDSGLRTKPACCFENDIGRLTKG